MWFHKRQFNLQEHSQYSSVEKDVGFITSLNYCVIPLDPTQWFHSITRRFSISVPELVQASQRLSQEVSGAGEPDEKHLQTLQILLSLYPRQKEFFFIGFSSGHVFQLEILPSSLSEIPLKRRDDTAAWELFNFVHTHRGSFPNQRCLDNSSEGSYDVLQIAHLGTLLGSIGGSATHASCVVSFFEPSCQPVVVLPHDGSLSPRSMLLWEGKEHWDADESEASALYAFVGCSDGCVRIWRINVSNQTYFLHSVLLSCTVGSQGLAAQYPTASERGVDKRWIRKPIFSMTLEGEGTNVTRAVRLVVGSEKWIIVWSLSRVLRKPTERANTLFPSDFDAKEAEIVDDLLFQPSFPLHRKLESFQTTTLFWVKSAKFVEAELEEATKSSSGGDLEYTVWKPKHTQTVAQGLAFGELIEFPKDSVGDLLRVTLQFSELRNSLKVPLRCVEPCLPPQLVFRGDDSGPIFSLLPLGHSKRLLSGGADGTIRSWKWVEDKYIPEFQIANAHTDLIKYFVRIRVPDIFVSVSYDGTVKQWQVYCLENDCVAKCSSVLTISTDLAAQQQTAAAPLGIGACCGIIDPCHALFLSCLFDNAIHTYSLEPVYTVELPEGFVFDGVKTIRIRSEGSQHQ